MKTILFFLFQLIIICCCAQPVSQYIGVKARYTESRTVDNSPEPPSRENRLVLSFYEVSAAGVYSPVVLSNYDIWIFKEGLQYGSMMGGVVDSAGNNYPGYEWTAPQAVSYYNSYLPNWIDCDPYLATQYTVNGHELDCGFIRVSSWQDGIEYFSAPNVCLPYYVWPDPFATLPGNVNFSWPVPPTGPYNSYSFSCAGSTQQFAVRGVLPHDSLSVPLPVRFAGVRGKIDANDNVTISWSNLTESNISEYIIERSSNNRFQSIGTVLPTSNNGGRSDYNFNALQVEEKAFYRIKAVENNGSCFYSTIISLSRNESEQQQNFSVYPNPVTNGEFTFRLSAADAGRYISFIIDPAGRQFKQKLIMHNGGDLIRQIDLTGLLPGIYQFVLQSEIKKYSQKILYVH